MTLIAIAGGIGSGKSVVSKILRAMDYSVYDCDTEAKRLMDYSIDIKRIISESISPDAIDREGCINRPILAEIVFNNADKLQILNDAVHSAVKNDLNQWCMGKKIAFVETAILYQSGLDKMVDAVWEVTAPMEIRVLRVIKRNNLNADQVRSRIKMQDEFIVNEKHPDTYYIDNEGALPLMPQITSLLKSLKK